VAADLVRVAAEAFIDVFNALPRAAVAPEGDHPTSCFRIDVCLPVEGAARMAAREIVRALGRAGVGGTCVPPLARGRYHFVSATGWHFGCEYLHTMNGAPRPPGSPIVTFDVWWTPALVVR
jgi:hypothetical protein